MSILQVAGKKVQHLRSAITISHTSSQLVHGPKASLDN